MQLIFLIELDHIERAYILHFILIAKKHNRKLLLQKDLCGIACYDLAQRFYLHYEFNKMASFWRREFKDTHEETRMVKGFKTLS